MANSSSASTSSALQPVAEVVAVEPMVAVPAASTTKNDTKPPPRVDADDADDECDICCGMSDEKRKIADRGAGAVLLLGVGIGVCYGISAACPGCC